MARRADKQEIKATQHASGEARTLAETLPRLILEARKIAATVIHDQPFDLVEACHVARQSA